MKKRSSFLLWLLCISSTLCAQESKNEKENKVDKKAISVTLHPLYLFNKAVKIDAELQSKKPLAFIAGAELYSGRVNSLYKQENSFGEATNDKISGLGINFAIKYKIQEIGGLNSYYISPGVTYRHLEINLEGPAFYSYQENGITYYTYGNTQQTQKVKPLVFYGNFGRYIEVNSVVLDVFCGLGYKFLKQNQQLLNTRNYHEEMFGYNYEGPIFQVGVKLGWQITK